MSDKPVEKVAACTKHNKHKTNTHAFSRFRTRDSSFRASLVQTSFPPGLANIDFNFAQFKSDFTTRNALSITNNHVSVFFINLLRLNDTVSTPTSYSSVR
jgi:hypothetical protein